MCCRKARTFYASLSGVVMKLYRVSTVLTGREHQLLVSLANKANSEEKEAIMNVLDTAMEVSEIPKEWRTKVAIFDLDGTACQFTETLEEVGDPMSGFKEVVGYLRSAGYRVGILTARPNSQSVMIKEFLKKEGIEIDFVQKDDKAKWLSCKPAADVYFCDMTFYFSGNWRKDLFRVKSLINAIEGKL